MKEEKEIPEEDFPLAWTLFGGASLFVILYTLLETYHWTNHFQGFLNGLFNGAILAPFLFFIYILPWTLLCRAIFKRVRFKRFFKLVAFLPAVTPLIFAALNPRPLREGLRES